MDESLEVETDFAASDDTPSDTAVGQVTYTKKVNDRELKERERKEFWRQVFSHPVGRREMWDILRKGRAFNRDRCASSQTGFPDPNATWFLLGIQDYAEGLFFDWQQITPEGVLLMLSEYDPRFARPKAPKQRRAA